MSALELCGVVKHYHRGREAIKAVDGVSLTVAQSGQGVGPATGS